MACELLVQRRDERKAIEGQALDLKDVDHPWSEMERLNDIVRLTDVSLKQARVYFESWFNTPSFNWSVPSGDKKTVGISVPQSVVEQHPEKGLQDSLEKWVSRDWNGTTTIIQPGVEAIVTLSADTDQALFEEDYAEQYEASLGPRYIFDKTKVTGATRKKFKRARQSDDVVELTGRQARFITTDRSQ